MFALRSCLPLRNGETLRLTWDQIHLNAVRPYISFSGAGDQSTKSGRERTVPIWYAHIAEMLRELPSRFAKGAVFTFQKHDEDEARAIKGWNTTWDSTQIRVDNESCEVNN